ncbi:Cytoplasmic dynein 1 heavy chain 1 [Durusdinium trenchii]|uniref:Cytoplasmic dynein 1 heavy chain 1 n=1 Tax=Durusdinium trenchii TaxID=1381693 RepID=A0ABP0JD30_9DINO
MSLAELKAFCGIQDGESLYYGEPEGFDADEADDASSQKSSQKTTTPTPSREGIPFSTRSQGAGPSDTSPPKPKGRDVIERLMQKGLIPLAALDVIRGWMVLEMTVGSDEDRRLIRAATRNKLGYTEIKAALLSMYEDKTNKTMFSSPLKGHGKSGHGKSGKSSAFYGGMEDPWKIDPNVGFDDNEVNHVEEEPDWDQSAWWTSDTSWYGHAWNGDDTSPKHEASEHLDDPEIFQHLMQEQDEYERQFQELQALTAESERNLAEARRAVSLAARDRGWNQPPQQRQPRYTSAYPFQKGKRPEAAGKGRMMYGEDAAWFKGAPGGHKGKSKSPSRPYSKGKGKDLHFHEHYMYPIFSAEHNPEELLASESIVDTGATATAGGRWAVQQLCSAVMNSRPNADMPKVGDRIFILDKEPSLKDSKARDEAFVLRLTHFLMANEDFMAQMKAAIKEAVAEHMEEMNGAQGSNDRTRPKGKAVPKKVKGYVKFDETRSQGPDQRDPRVLPDTWPCYGNHQDATMGNNRYGQWTECAKCGLRLKYTPTATAPAQTTKTNLPMNVTEAIAKLRSEGWAEEEMSAQVMKSAIEVVAKQKVLEKNPKPKAKSKEAAKKMADAVPIPDSDPEPDSGFEKADHDMHHDGDEEAGEDARHRALESAERQKLLKAAEEFNVGAFLASLQDCGKPFVIWEVCCHPESALTNSCRSMGLTAWRKTLEDHYDIEKDTTRVRLLQDQVVEKPKRTWWSLKCTPWTNIQNINQRNESQIEMLKKKRRKARRGVKVATQTILDLLDHDPEVRFYWEWPKSAYAGWSLAEMQNFVNILEKRNIRLFWTQLDGCMFGVKSPQDEPLKKEWLIMNNDADFHSQCHVLCDGSHVHRDGGLVGIGSVAVEATGYYPKPMTDMIAKRWKSQKEQVLRKNYHEEASRVLELMTKDIEMFPVQQQEGEATKKEKEKAEALLHKLHKASGHPTNRALARLCADRGMPGWMVQMAKELKCAACVHSQQGGQMVIPYSLGAKPGPWHFVSADVMDLVFPALRLKARVLVATCVVMKFLAAKVVWTGEVGVQQAEPTGEWQKDAQRAMDEWRRSLCRVVSFDIEDVNQLLYNGTIYTKKMMETSKEINFRNLTPEDRELVLESMARELSEVMSSRALKLIQDNISQEEVEKRCIPMRWLLTWKPFDVPQDPTKEAKPGVIRADGLSKAKARIVLIGYKHPDLGKRDPRTGQQMLPTSSPTLSRMGRNVFLQAVALDHHTLECADARSAFLQASVREGNNRLFTKAVPEISAAFNVPAGTALEVVGVIYGLTTAPRLFWLDVDNRIQKLTGEPHGIDKCLWVFKDPSTGHVVGRVGVHVDDFLIAGDLQNDVCVNIRSQIKAMYQWSPWKRGQFTFAGVQLQQLQDFSIVLSQELFCNELTPVIIQNERMRPKDDKLTASELSQCRGLLMKAQWRAIQSAPQYCCRIGLASSSLTKATLDVLKEANSIVKELRKTSQDSLIFHSFFEENVKWNQVIFVHFGDAARGNRIDGSDTGGYISAVASPKILQGTAAKMSILDYKSWKLDRPVRGSNGSEGQALYFTEDAGWKIRLVWALIYGKKLKRANADELTACVESLLVMDSRGCYDALSNSDSPLLGMNNAKTGTELMAVQRGLQPHMRCYPTWTPSDMNLSDCMTKVSTEAFKVYALYLTRKTWIIRFNEEFVAARKQQKLRRQQGKQPHALLDPDPEDEMWAGLER